jgi:hypothetical protein
MNTDQIVRDFSQTHQTRLEQRTSAREKIKYWVYEHPTVIKTAEIAGMVLGVGLIVTLPLSWSVLGFSASLLALGGGILATASLIAYKFLDILVSPSHSMDHHTFTPASFGAGRLYYQGDVPVLELQSDDPYQAGLAHGYLVGKQLRTMLDRLSLVKRFAHFPEADKVSKALELIKETVPAEYQEELNGLVAGFNRWLTENQGPEAKLMTFDDILLFHLMPDSIHFSPQDLERSFAKTKEWEEKKSSFVPLACTVVIDQDQKKGMTFGRNMDWPSFGLLGGLSLIINRKYSRKYMEKEKASTAEIGLPGFTGTLTGMNKHGLSLAMNVCSGSTDFVRGMPAAFFNRFCLENCQNVANVSFVVNQMGIAPLGPYHLSAADPHTAKSFHFYQKDLNSHVERELQEDQPLIVTNCRYTPSNEQSCHMHYSAERQAVIRALFSTAKKQLAPSDVEQRKLVEASLSLKPVNNTLTTHKVVMHPQSRKMKVAFDNAFAGKATLHKLKTTSFFVE